MAAEVWNVALIDAVIVSSQSVAQAIFTSRLVRALPAGFTLQSSGSSSLDLRGLVDISDEKLRNEVLRAVSSAIQVGDRLLGQSTFLRNELLVDMDYLHALSRTGMFGAFLFRTRQEGERSPYLRLTISQISFLIASSSKPIKESSEGVDQIGEKTLDDIQV